MGPVGEIQPAEYIADPVFVGAFDFDEGAQMGQFVEADEAGADCPDLAGFFDPDGGGQAKLLKESDGGVIIGDLKFGFLPAFVGSRQPGSLPCEGEGLPGCVGLSPEAQAAVFFEQAVFGVFEIEVFLAGKWAGFGAEALEPLPDRLQRRDGDLGFHFKMC